MLVKIRIRVILLLILLGSSGMQAQNKVPVYLDDNQPIKDRVEDALKRMTTEEKIGHDGSKRLSFSLAVGPGEKRENKLSFSL